jgi:hypothetical protein
MTKGLQMFFLQGYERPSDGRVAPFARKCADIDTRRVCIPRSFLPAQKS